MPLYGMTNGYAMYIITYYICNTYMQNVHCTSDNVHCNLQ